MSLLSEFLVGRLLAQQSSIEGIVDFTFTCARCSTVTPARISAIGSATDSVDRFTGLSEAAANAEAGAALGLADDAARVGAAMHMSNRQLSRDSARGAPPTSKERI